MLSQQEVRKLITQGDDAKIWVEASNRYLEAIAKMLYRKATGEDFTPDRECPKEEDTK